MAAKNKKIEFIRDLRVALRNIDAEEAEKLVSYYDEIISDRIDGGEHERDVIQSLNSPEQIAKEYIGENYESRVSAAVSRGKEKVKKAGLFHNKTFWIVYFSAFIITFPLTAAFFGVAFGLLAALFSLILAVYVVGGACTIVGVFGFISIVFGLPSDGWHLATGYGTAAAVLGVGLLFIALSIGLSRLIKKIFSKSVRKGEAK